MTQSFPFKAVIFDMDGVLIDTELYYWNEIRHFSEDLGLGITKAELDAQVGQSHQTFQRNVAFWLERAGKGVVEPAVAGQMFNDWSKNHVKNYDELLNPGIHETIDELKRRGVRVALASSTPLEGIKEALEGCKLTDAFELVVSGADFTESKPNPEIYLHTISALGLAAEDCCCVEDSVPGITAGKAAGLTVFAKREDRFGFSQDAADVIIDEVPDILEAAPRLFG